MQCPKCGANTRVNKTQGAMGLVNRIRECLSLACRQIFTTVEAVNSPPEYARLSLAVKVDENGDITKIEYKDV